MDETQRPAKPTGKAADSPTYVGALLFNMASWGMVVITMAALKDGFVEATGFEAVARFGGILVVGFLWARQFGFMANRLMPSRRPLSVGGKWKVGLWLAVDAVAIAIASAI